MSCSAQELGIVGLDRRGVLYVKSAGAPEWKELPGDADRTEVRALTTMPDGTVIAVGVLIPVTRLDHALAALLRDSFGWQLGLLLTGSITALVYACVVRYLTAALQAVDASSDHVFTVGLGGEVDVSSLQGLGKDGYWPVANAEGLQAAFEEIAARVRGVLERRRGVVNLLAQRIEVLPLQLAGAARSRDFH